MILTPVATARAEILAPGEGVDVYLRRSPLRQKREHFRVPAGWSVTEILEFCEVEPSRLYISINGHSIEHKNWSRVRVKPDATLTVVKVPGKGALRSILGAVVAIAAAIFAPYLLPAALAGTAVGTAVTGLIAAGLTMAGSLAINALFPVAKSETSSSTKTLYSIGGAQNQSTQYGAVPEIFGVHRISPPYAAGPYTEISGDDQYLRMLFVVGHGPIDVSDLKIAETDIDTFDDVKYEIIPDHTVESPTLYTRPVLEESVSVLLDEESGWVTRTTADDVSWLSVDVSFPNGVYRSWKSDGKMVNYRVTIQAQYSVADANDWVSFGPISVYSNSSQALRRSINVTVPEGKYDIRLRKSTSDYDGDDTVSETCYWTAVRGRRNEKAIKFDKPLTLIALRIRATNELNGTVNQLNCTAKPRIPSWNGSSWVPGQITKNPADHFRRVLQGNANARPVADESIDFESIQNWHEYCNAQGFTYNLVASDQKSVYDRLTEIAAAGRASVTFNDGKWGVIWDVAGTDIVQHFTPRNSSGFSSTRAYADLPHGFRVSFINEDNGYLNDERVVYDDGYSEANATKFEGLDFPGVTDTDLIWRHGRYHIAQLRLQRETYALTTDFEQLVCTRGDRVRVNHDVVLWGLGSARVKAVLSGPDTVILDDTMTMEAGKNYSIRFRLSDGTSLVRTITGVAGEGTEFVLDGSDALPTVGDLAMFGENGLESVVLRVKSITAQKDLSAQLELVDDAPGILEADTGDIPPFDTGIPALVDYRAYAPTSLSAVESIWTTSPATSEISLSWVAPEIRPVKNYVVQYAVKGSGNWSLPFTTTVPNYDLTNLGPGAYDVTVRAVFDNGQLSGALTRVVDAVLFASEPDDVTGFVIAVTGDLATLQWDPLPAESGISHYEIRYSPVASALVTWQTALVLRSAVTAAQAQVPPLKGTYLIKATSFSGLQSRNAAIIVSTIDGLTSFNAVEAVEEIAPFPGVKGGTYFDGTALRLDVGTDAFQFLDYFGPADYFISGGGYLASGTYDFEEVVDLGEIYTSRVSAQINAFGEWSSDDFFSLDNVFGRADFFGDVGSLWDVSLQVSVTNDDPTASPTWSDWTPLITGDLSGRGYRFRAVLESEQSDVTPVVTSIAVTVDMPDRVIAGNDIVIPTGGMAVPFSPAFKHLQGVSIAAQGLQTGDYYQITAKSEAGFTIAFKDAAGAAISRTFDYVAKGYGTVQ